MIVSGSIFLMLFSGYQLNDKARPPISKTHYQRYIWLLCLVVICGVIGAYLAFVSIVIVWVGVTHSTQSGSWVPVLVGSVCLSTIFFVFLIVVKYACRNVKEEDIVNI